MVSTAHLELLFNGINGTTGRPLLPPLTPREVARLARGESWDPDDAEDLRRWHEYLRRDHMDTRFGVDSRDLAESGWGVVFPAEKSEPLCEALAPLLKHRRVQATRADERLYRELFYRPGESKQRFLARHGAGPGPVDPERVPYYLLLVGSPEEIPFRFQYQLDVQYAVGRLHFETAEEYARYAESVVEAETGALALPRRAAFFAVAHPGDRATERSLRHLAEPLAAELAPRWGSWSMERFLAGDATKAALTALLGGPRIPAVLFTASHGLGFEADDPRQLAHQGALLCQDWPGAEALGQPVTRDHYLAADDIADAACPAGLIAIHFACFGAGTPRWDSFQEDGAGLRRAIAPHNFLARLPQRLMGHPRGGALAVVGHVDRAWSYSFDWPRAGEQLEVFTSTLGRLLEGYPVGAAMEYFNQRHAELSADLTQELEEARYGASADLLSLAALWTANNDARSFVVLGDPAVRLAVGEAGTADGGAAGG